MKKKILSMLVTATMLLSLFPMVTYAEAKSVDSWAELQAAINDSTEGDVISLNADITAQSSEKQITIANKTVTLDLNGYVLDRGLPEKQLQGAGAVIKLSGSASLTIEDSRPNVAHEGYVDASGLWHNGKKKLLETGEEYVTLNGGIITGGSDSPRLHNTKKTETEEARTGGIWLSSANTKLVMNGGTIAGNRSVRPAEMKGDMRRGAGGVVVASDAQFIMNGGRIAYNTAGGFGGGVLVWYPTEDKNPASFIITGGSIDHNTSLNDGGGVYLTSHTSRALNFEKHSILSMYGGTIENNTCVGNGAGVCHDTNSNENANKSYCYVYLGGTAKIKNNKDTAGKASNLYANVPGKIALADDDYPIPLPKDGMEISLSIEGGAGAITSQTDVYDKIYNKDWYTTPPAPADILTSIDYSKYVKYFSSDDPGYAVKNITKKEENTPITYDIICYYISLERSSGVRFNSCGGSKIEYNSNGLPAKAPTREFCVFGGWYTKRIGGELVHDGKKFVNGYANFVDGKTYYARWYVADKDGNATSNIPLEEAITVKADGVYLGESDIPASKDELKLYGITFQKPVYDIPATVTLTNTYMEILNGVKGLEGTIYDVDQTTGTVTEVKYEKSTMNAAIVLPIKTKIVLSGTNTIALSSDTSEVEYAGILAAENAPLELSGGNENTLTIDVSDVKNYQYKWGIFARNSFTNGINLTSTGSNIVGIYVAKAFTNTGKIDVTDEKCGMALFGDAGNTGIIKATGGYRGVRVNKDFYNTGEITGISTSSAGSQTAPLNGESTDSRGISIKGKLEASGDSLTKGMVTGESGKDSIGIYTGGALTLSENAKVEGSSGEPYVTGKFSIGVYAGGTINIDAGSNATIDGYATRPTNQDNKSYAISTVGGFAAEYSAVNTTKKDAFTQIYTGESLQQQDFSKSVVVLNANTKYIVKFETGEGSPVASSETNAHITKPDDPTRENYAFGGWYSDEKCTKAWNFDFDFVSGNTTLYAKWIDNKLSPVSTPHSILNGGPNLERVGAKIELYKGGELVASTISYKDAEFELGNVLPGDYNLVVTTYTGKCMTTAVHIDGNTIPDIAIPDKSVNSILTISENPDVKNAKADVSDIIVGNLNEVSEEFTPAGSDNVTVRFNVEPQANNDNDALQGHFRSEAYGSTLDFFDATLTKQINDNTPVDYGDENTTLLTMIIPFDFTDIDINSIKVLRNHNDKLDVLPKLTVPGSGEGFTVDTVAGTITVYACKFSTYALAYYNYSSPHGNNNGSGGGSTGGSANAVKTPTSVKNGSISVSPKSPKKGETVTVNATPDNGYEIDKLTVKDSKGNIVDITDLGDGKYTFTMPDGTVSIDIAFKETESETDDKTGEETDDETDDEPKDIDSDSASTFTDVKESDWFYNQVKYVYDNKLMMGITDTEFAPNMPVTRAMFVTVLYRMEEEPEVTNSNVFTDVKSGEYYENAVIWAQGNEIVKGISKTEYAPNMNITREQMAAIIYRYANFKGIDTESVMENTNTLSHNDIFKVSEYAKEAMNYCIAAGIITGDNNGNLNPQNNATRAEFATILMRSADIIK